MDSYRCHRPEHGEPASTLASRASRPTYSVCPPRSFGTRDNSRCGQYFLLRLELDVQVRVERVGPHRQFGLARSGPA